MSFHSNSIKHQRQPQITTIKKIEGANSRIYDSSGGLFEGDLLTICSSRVGAYSRGFFCVGTDLRYICRLISARMAQLLGSLTAGPRICGSSP